MVDVMLVSVTVYSQGSVLGLCSVIFRI